MHVCVAVPSQLVQHMGWLSEVSAGHQLPGQTLAASRLVGDGLLYSLSLAHSCLQAGREWLRNPGLCSEVCHRDLGFLWSGCVLLCHSSSWCCFILSLSACICFHSLLLCFCTSHLPFSCTKHLSSMKHLPWSAHVVLCSRVLLWRPVGWGSERAGEAGCQLCPKYLVPHWPQLAATQKTWSPLSALEKIFQAAVVFWTGNRREVVSCSGDDLCSVIDVRSCEECGLVNIHWTCAICN